MTAEQLAAVANLSRSLVATDPACRCTLGPDPDGALGVAWLAAHCAEGRYDPARGEVLPYVRRAVRRELLHAAHDASHCLRVPRDVRYQAWRQDNGLPVTRRHGAQLEAAQRALRAMSVSLADADHLPHRTTEPEHGADEVGIVRAALACLDDRERRIIELRYGLADGRERSLAETGRCVGESKQRVHQIERAALGKLREQMRG